MAVSHFTPPGASGNRNDAESQLVLTKTSGELGEEGGDHNSPRPEVDALTHYVCVRVCKWRFFRTSIKAFLFPQNNNKYYYSRSSNSIPCSLSLVINEKRPYCFLQKQSPPTSLHDRVHEWRGCGWASQIAKRTWPWWGTNWEGEYCHSERSESKLTKSQKLRRQFFTNFQTDNYDTSSGDNDVACTAGSMYKIYRFFNQVGGNEVKFRETVNLCVRIREL